MSVRHRPSTYVDDEAAIANVLSSMHAHFIACARERVNRIAALATARHTTDDRRAPLQQLVREAHTIKGSAATFGFPALGTAAAMVEHAGCAELEGMPEQDPVDRAVEALVESLRNVR